MIAYLVMTLFLAGVIVIYLVTPRSLDESLSPRGGPRWKVFLSYLIMTLGSLKKEDTIGFSEVNHRIPPLPGKESDDYNNSFVFQGSDRAGNLFMTRIGFRGDGTTAEVWLWMVLDGEKYVIPLEMAPVPSDDRDRIEAGGIKYTCLDKTDGIFQISYKGPLNEGIKEALVDLEYQPVSVMYHSSLIDMFSVARSMSEMTWTGEYFKKLSSENQSRIEQGGTLTGVITLDGRKHEINMFSIRDHAWGKRKWNFIERYIWIILSFEDDLVINNSRYRYMIFATVNYGTSFKHVVTGWVAGTEGVLPIGEGTHMKHCGGDGVIPDKYTYQFRASGGPLVDLTIKRSQIEHSWFTQDNTFEICEAYCVAECNGVQGHGMSEFGYSKREEYKRDFP